MTALQGKKLVIFDLDGTLTPSKQPMKESMALLLLSLIKQIKVAVISGGGYPQFQSELLRLLPADTEGLSNLYLLPTSGTKLLMWQGKWVEKYKEDLPEKDKKRIIEAFDVSLRQIGFETKSQSYGELVEDRGSQITFSGLGQQAPLELKMKWDPTREKRKNIVEILQQKIPEFGIRIGGTTSIDVTSRGMSKSYGIHKLEQYLGIPLGEMLFVGDSLFYGGNDYPVKATGIDCIEVKGPEETEDLVRSWFS